MQALQKDKRYPRSILRHENMNREERYGNIVPGPVLEGKQRSLARTEQIIFLVDLQAQAFEREHKSSGKTSTGSHHTLDSHFIIY